MWLYLVGPQWAKRMLLTGDVLTGADAAKIGLGEGSEGEIPLAELWTIPTGEEGVDEGDHST